MKLARSVKRRHALDELRERLTQTLVVDAALLIAHVPNEVRAAHELHGEEHVTGFRGDELVQPNQVRVLHVGEGPKLLLEAKHRRGVGLQQSLYSDRALRFAVE